MSRPSPRRARWAPLLLTLALLRPAPGAAQGASYEQLQTFSSLLNQIRINYVDSVSYAQLVRAEELATQAEPALAQHRRRQRCSRNAARRPFTANVDDATATEIAPQIDRGDVGAGGVEVQRRIGVRADMHRHADRADVARRAALESRDPLARERRVAGKRRRRLVDRLADVPDAQSVLPATHPGRRSFCRKRS